MTILLEAAGRGDADALGQLFELLYPDLRRMAHARLRDDAPDGLHTTDEIGNAGAGHHGGPVIGQVAGQVGRRTCCESTRGEQERI